jgi:hypothetical protein
VNASQADEGFVRDGVLVTVAHVQSVDALQPLEGLTSNLMTPTHVQSVDALEPLEGSTSDLTTVTHIQGVKFCSTVFYQRG